MTFLPIVARELRAAARRRGTYWLRSGAALAMVAIGGWVFLVMQGMATRDLAVVLFRVLAGGAVAYALLSGVRSTADCLSEEKREGTLGLLFLTDLKGYDVVLGKFTAASVGDLYGVLAIVPTLAIPLLMGGITGGEFARMALVALDTLFFSLALGMGISAFSRSAQRAFALTFLALVWFAGGLPLCAALRAWLQQTSQLQPVLLMPSAWYAFYLAPDTVYATQATYFWSSLGVIHGFGWFFLAAASVVAPRVWQDQPAGKRLRWREYWQLWSYGNPVQRARFRRRLLERNAFFWLAARGRLKPAGVWAALVGVAAAWGWGFAKLRRDWLDVGVYVVTALTLNWLLRSWFAAEAARQLAEERKAGTLELLLSTPLRVREILRGQLMALRRQFLGPVVVALGVEITFLVATVSDPGVGDERNLWITLWTAGMLMLLADLAALYWVGLWQGLTARNAIQAQLASWVRILIVPWAAYALVLLVMALVFLNTRRAPEPNWQFFVGLWFVLGLLADLGFGAHARYKLMTGFRLAAERRYAPRESFWKRLFGESQSPAPVNPALPNRE